MTEDKTPLAPLSVEEQKQDFIGAYLDKKMKNHNLPYGMAYYNKLSKHEEEAEKKWANQLRKNTNNH